MMISTRLSVAIHILTLIASQPREQLTSEFIANSVNTHPVVIRRISSQLKKAGLISSQTGIAGATLTRDPAHVTLLDVYQAVQTHDEWFSVHKNPNPFCTVGKSIQATLNHTFDKVQKGMEDELARQSLKDIMNHLFSKKER